MTENMGRITATAIIVGTLWLGMGMLPDAIESEQQRLNAKCNPYRALVDNSHGGKTWQHKEALTGVYHYPGTSIILK